MKIFLFDSHPLVYGKGGRGWGLIFLTLFILTGCDGLIGAPPTRTPTPDMPLLEASPTVNPLPPTPVFGEVMHENNPTAAAAPNNSDAIPALDATIAIEQDPNKPQLLSIGASDGASLSAEFYAASVDVAPVALVIGMQTDNWGGFPLVLRNAGFAVLVVETRVPALQDDFTAIINTIATLPGVDPNRIGVIGGSGGADVALISCSAEPRCTTLILLSPSQQAALMTAIQSYNPRSLLMFASRDDTGVMQTADALRQAATGEVSLQMFEEAGRGSQIVLNRPEVSNIIIDWLNRHLK